MAQRRETGTCVCDAVSVVTVNGAFRSDRGSPSPVRHRCTLRHVATTLKAVNAFLCPSSDSFPVEGQVPLGGNSSLPPLQTWVQVRRRTGQWDGEGDTGLNSMFLLLL